MTFEEAGRIARKSRLARKDVDGLAAKVDAGMARKWKAFGKNEQN